MSVPRAAVPLIAVVPAYLTGLAVGTAIGRAHNSGRLVQARRS